MVSVIIPVFNGQEFLAAAIESVLNQTWRDIEIIVVDDGSTDATSKIANRFPAVRYFYQRHRGVAAARNLGVRVAKGELIAFLDADDLFVPTKLEKQVKYLQEHPEIDRCYTEIRNFTDIPEDDLTDRQKKVMTVYVREILPSLCARRSLFERNGVFDVALPYGEDTEWTDRLSILEETRLYTLKEQLYLRRIHQKNLTASHECLRKETARHILLKSKMHAAIIREHHKISVILQTERGDMHAEEQKRRFLGEQKRKLLEEAVVSVLNQNWLGSLELIIIDAAEDMTKAQPGTVTEDMTKKRSGTIAEEVVEKYSCRLIREKQGGAFAKNKGLEAATGDLILFLKAGEVLADNAAELLLKVLSNPKQPDVVFGNVEVLYMPELTGIEPDMLRGMFDDGLSGRAIMRRSVFKKTGYFDPAAKECHESEWMQRLTESGSIVMQTDAVAVYRKAGF